MDAHVKSLLRSRSRDADYLEIRLEDSHLTRIEYRGRSLELLGQSLSYGGNVRALVNGGWGFVSFNSVDDLEGKLDRAIGHARLISAASGSGSALADTPAVQDEVSPDLDTDPRSVPLERKKTILDLYNQAMLDASPEIKSTGVHYFDRHTTLTFANSEGTFVKQNKADVALGLSAIATRNGLTQVSTHSVGGSSGFDLVLGQEQGARAAAEKATDLLDARPVKGGEYTVILDPILAGVFVHEAFGHLSEADEVYDNARLRELMKLGTRYGPANLRIYDSGLHSGTRAHMRYDDEGVATEKTYLINDGTLVGRLHSRESAGRMGERPTGNARALDYRFRPICRMRTTCIEGGDSTFDDMLRDVRLGVYAVKAYGGQTNGEMFTFTAGEAYMIRDGALAELVRDVTLTGNVFQTLDNIDMIGNDFTLSDGPGGCGKGAQSPLPTTVGSPHIRVQKVVIGGRE